MIKKIKEIITIKFRITIPEASEDIAAAKGYMVGI